VKAQADFSENFIVTTNTNTQHNIKKLEWRSFLNARKKKFEFFLTV
jgi:hypothetical protein